MAPLFNSHRSLRRVGLTAITACCIGSAALAQQPPGAPGGPPPGAPPSVLGVWYDDTGQGAIEMIPCNAAAEPGERPQRLCGRIVWLAAPSDKSGKPLTDGYNPQPRLRARPICGLQVIGDVKLQRGGTWDEGWIYDPKEGKSYDVEIRLRRPDQLQVTGYLGVKFLSETFIWRRAPADIARCDRAVPANAPAPIAPSPRQARR